MEQAIALDHGYALPYVAMAECGLTAAFWGFIEPRKALARCSAPAVEALMRDDTLAEAHIALGAVNGLADFDWAGAEHRLRRGLDLNPGSPDARYGYGAYLLRSMGRIDEALSQCQRAVELDPLSPALNSGAVWWSLFARRFEPAEEQIRRIIARWPELGSAHPI